MAQPIQLLICDDDKNYHLAVKEALKGTCQCRSAYHADEALAILRNHPIEIVLLDVQMRTQDEGLKAIPRILECDPDVAIIMGSGLTDFSTVREAMRMGAMDYIPKDFNPTELILSVELAIKRRALQTQSQQKDFEVVTAQKSHPLLGESPLIQALRRTLERVRQSNANVVITGETGTGKEVVARQLRKTLPDGTLEPFVAVDSSTIQGGTAESHLFGHEKGAFTGAEKTTKGIFEEAHGGVVYFDEIANMPLEIQAKLLRALQEKEISRLGSAKSMKLEFRVICATNRDLEQMIKEGKFKEDLFQRLCVLPLEIPPLRDRKEDIALLARHFVSRQSGRGEVTFSPEAIALLQEYRWPGNVRELGNLVAYVLTMAEGPIIEVADLPPKFRDKAKPAVGGDFTGAGGEKSFYDRISDLEKKILTEAYSNLKANVSKMALTLGMDRSHLYTKLRDYGIHPRKEGKETGKETH